MQIQLTLTDDAIVQEIGDRVAAARLLRNLTQADLAHEAGVSKRTVERLEAGEPATRLAALVRVLRALRMLDRLDALLPTADATPMQQLHRRGHARQRATGTRQVKESGQPWRWNTGQ